MKEIQLTQGQVALIDDEDWELVSGYRWHAWYSKTTKSYYARASISNEKGGRAVLYLHRVLVGAPKGKVVDHQNHNTLDNRKSNLRTCSQSENMMNSGRRSSNSSGYKGVSWDKWSNKWVAQICLNGKHINLGRFIGPQEAYAAYCEAAKLHHGEFFTPG